MQLLGNVQQFTLPLCTYPCADIGIPSAADHHFIIGSTKIYKEKSHDSQGATGGRGSGGGVGHCATRPWRILELEPSAKCDQAASGDGADSGGGAYIIVLMISEFLLGFSLQPRRRHQPVQCWLHVAYPDCCKSPSTEGHRNPLILLFVRNNRCQSRI